MVAVRRFEEAKVVRQIMEVFWRQGYAATSIDDLVAATGVKRGSLYNAFGDKERMFLLAFDAYVDQVIVPLLAALGDGDAKAGIGRFFDAQIAELRDEGSPPACMMANGLAEFAQCSPPIQQKIARHEAELETALYERLLRSQAEGELAPGRDVRALARYFASVVRLLPMLYRANRDERFVRDVATTALEVL